MGHIPSEADFSQTFRFPPHCRLMCHVPIGRSVPFLTGIDGGRAYLRVALHVPTAQLQGAPPTVPSAVVAVRIVPLNWMHPNVALK